MLQVYSLCGERTGHRNGLQYTGRSCVGVRPDEEREVGVVVCTHTHVRVSEYVCGCDDEMKGRNQSQEREGVDQGEGGNPWKMNGDFHFPVQ